MQITDFLVHLADTDLYKITMGQLVWHRFPDTHAEYEFINRPRNPLAIPAEFANVLKDLINQMDQLQFPQTSLDFLSKQFPFLNSNYLAWLKNYRLNPKQISITQTDELTIHIEGPWHEAIFWETPLLCLTTELANVLTQKTSHSNWQETLKKNTRLFESAHIQFLDFGTRRRFSLDFHEQILTMLKHYAPHSFLGTSNVALAEKIGFKPVGTFAHELVQAHAALFGYEKANEMTLTNWLEEFQGNFATALTDTFTTEVFLRSYPQFADRIKTFRHDSGDPFMYIDRIVSYLHHQKLDIKNYTIVFSNELIPENVIKIADYCKQKGIKSFFGIGSYLTHTLIGHQAPDIVIKLMKLNRQEVCKLSDEAEKTSGSPQEIERARRILKII